MDHPSRVLLLVAIVCGVALALVLVVPYMAPYGSFRYLDGTPGVMDGGWEGHGLPSLIYAVGDMTCHQRYDRSFVLNGSQLPICMREVGILAGLTLGAAVTSILGDRVATRPFLVVSVVMVAFIVVEWGVETTGIDMPIVRTLSGVSAGIGGTLFLGWWLRNGRGTEIM